MIFMKKDNFSKEVFTEKSDIENAIKQVRSENA